MKKYSLSCFVVYLLFLLPLNLFGQITFPSGTNLCDYTPYKLVWYENFDGYRDGSGTLHNDLNPLIWHKYSELAPYGFPVVYDSSNITVAGGICTLAVKHTPASGLDSNGTLVHSNYTVAKIKTDIYNRPYFRYLIKASLKQGYLTRALTILILISN